MAETSAERPRWLWAEWRRLANLITLSRLIVFPPLFLMLWPLNRWLGLGAFFMGMMTDALDGWVARRQGTADGSLGKLLDPLADKALMVSALIITWPNFVVWGVIGWRLGIEAGLILTAALGKLGMRIYQRRLSVEFQALIKRKEGANPAGKAKTVFDTVLVGVMIAIIMSGQASAFSPVLQAGVGLAISLASASLLWHWRDIWALRRRFLSEIERHP